MTVVWKFRLSTIRSAIKMPQGATVLHFDLDPASDCPAVWALVNPEAEKETRTFLVVGTGIPVPDGGVYLGTLIDHTLVWHLFDITLSHDAGATRGTNVSSEPLQ